MSGIDVTVVVTAHHETAVCGPTMKAADLAVEAARRDGYDVQNIIALDKATERTTEYFHQSRFDHWERWATDEGDLARVRNAIISRAQGRYITFLDAGDLFSENWLADGIAELDLLSERSEQVIAHPELSVVFDGAKCIRQTVDSTSPLFTPHDLYLPNGHDSPCLTPRQAHLEAPYVECDVPNGLAHPDWQFVIETLARGWRHIVVQDTIVFRRRRDAALAAETNSLRSIVRSLPEMAIDRVRGLAR